MPRLPGIRKALPDTSVAVTVLEDAPNLSRDLFDLSLFMRQPTGDCGETVIAEDQIFGFVHRALPRTSISTVTSVSILSCTTTPGRKTGPCGVFPCPACFPISREVLDTPNYSIALAEALAGAGILIGHHLLVEDSIRRGDLVRPFPQTWRL